MTTTPRRTGHVVGYLLLASIGALAVAALVLAIGVATWAARWALGVL